MRNIHSNQFALALAGSNQTNLKLFSYTKSTLIYSAGFLNFYVHIGNNEKTIIVVNQFNFCLGNNETLEINQLCLGSRGTYLKLSICRLRRLGVCSPRVMSWIESVTMMSLSCKTGDGRCERVVRCRDELGKVVLKIAGRSTAHALRQGHVPMGDRRRERLGALARLFLILVSSATKHDPVAVV